jgi:prepilin-type processing-associated H-X9-DG protein
VIPVYQCPSASGATVNKFQCNLGTMMYAMNNQIAPVPNGATNISLGINDIVDGTSNTMLMAEKALMDAPFLAVGSVWGASRICASRLTIVAAQCKMNAPFDGTHNATTMCYVENASPLNLVTRAAVASPHEGGAHFLMCDGAVRFVGENISASPTPGSASGAENFLYQNLFNINDKNPIGEF